MTQEASGNIWAPTIIFSNSPLSDQTIVDQQVAAILNWKCNDFGFKGCSDCAKKGCSNPSTTRGSSRGVAFSLFYICVRIYSLSRLILSSRWLTTVEQKTQSLTPESSKTHLLVSLISRNTHLTPRLIDKALVLKLNRNRVLKNWNWTANIL